MIALVVATALATTPVPGLSYDELAAYYAEHGAGAIVPAEPSEVRFHVVAASPERVRVAPHRPYWQNRRLFRFDARAFLDATGAPTVQDGRRAFYAAQPFLEREQEHARPYAYMDAWGQLFHPPIDRLDLPIEAYTDLFPPERQDAVVYFDPAFQEEIDRVSGTELTWGNEVELLSSGEAYHEKLRMVREAQDSLYVSVMFFGCDETSDTLAEAMAERVRAGVDVRLINEAVYRAFLSKRCIDRLEVSGVKVVSVGASAKPRTMQAVMHQKFWIRDGEELVLGGSNVLDFENLGDNTDFLDRDLDLHVRGPMVADAVESFLETWSDYDDADDSARLAAVRQQMAAERAAGLRGAEWYADWLSNPARRDHGVCRAAMQGLMADTEPIAPVLEAHLRAAREQVVFVAPAMRVEASDPPEVRAEARIGRIFELIERSGPDAPQLVAITNGAGGGAGELGIWLRRHAARAGPGAVGGGLFSQYDKVVSRRAAIRNLAGARELLQRNANADVWAYFGHLHSKSWLFDRTATVVGSWNPDLNSGDMNYEAAIFCLDRGLREDLEQDFTEILVNSVPVTLDDEG